MLFLPSDQMTNPGATPNCGSPELLLNPKLICDALAGRVNVVDTRPMVGAVGPRPITTGPVYVSARSGLVPRPPVSEPTFGSMKSEFTCMVKLLPLLVAVTVVDPCPIACIPPSLVMITMAVSCEVY